MTYCSAKSFDLSVISYSGQFDSTVDRNNEGW
jgi:hypothetical protein